MRCIGCLDINIYSIGLTDVLKKIAHFQPCSKMQKSGNMDFIMLMAHKIERHAVDLLSCKDCEYKTTNKRNHDKHKCIKKRRQKAPIPKDLKCEICDYKPGTLNRMILKVHMQSVHLGMKHKCEQCNFDW